MSSIVIVISFSLLIVVSFCGNTLVCRTLFRQRRFCANSTNVLIGMLAISDLMMTIFNIPFTVADIILNDWIFGDFFCILVSFVQANSVYVSSFTMAVIAIDRCKAIYKFRPKQVSNDAPSNNNNNSNNNYISNNSKLNGNAINMNSNDESISNHKLVNNGCCCLIDCFTFNCTLMRSNTTTRFKMELRTKMILIISAIWIMAALHSLPHTIFNRVTVIEVNNVIIDTSNPFDQTTNKQNDRKDNFQSNNNRRISAIDAFDDFLVDKNQSFSSSSSSITAATTTSEMIIETNNTKMIRRCIPITPSWFGPKFSLWLTLYTTTTQYIIPLSCAAIIYTRIAFTINSQGRVGQMTESRADRINKHKRRRLLMLALIVAIFAICWLPFNIYYLLLDFGITKSYNHTAFLFCLWLATSSVCYNPFVYCWLNKSFRQEAKIVWNYLYQAFSCCCCCCRRFNYSCLYRNQNQHNNNNYCEQSIIQQNNQSKYGNQMKFEQQQQHKQQKQEENNKTNSINSKENPTFSTSSSD